MSEQIQQYDEEEEIILSECGHGFRSFRWEGPNWMGKPYERPMRSVLELVESYLDEGPKVSIDDGLLSVAIGVAAHKSIDEDRWVSMDEVLG